MATDFAEQLEEMVKDLQAVMAKVNANSKAIKDAIVKMAALVKTMPRQGERRQRLLERSMSPLPKGKPQDDNADCEAAIAVIRKTRRASVSHFQRQLGWGYNRASRILSLLQTRGIVGEKIGEMSYEILKLPRKPTKRADALKNRKRVKGLVHEVLTRE